MYATNKAGAISGAAGERPKHDRPRHPDNLAIAVDDAEGRIDRGPNESDVHSPMAVLVAPWPNDLGCSGCSTEQKGKKGGSVATICIPNARRL